MKDTEELGWFRNLVAAVGARVIYFFIWLFGKKCDPESMPWLAGPVGGNEIGDAPYEECARLEGLTLERESKRGGLVDDFERLRSDTFDVDRVSKEIRHFYENTAEYAMDVWSKTSFPMNIGLWLLVTTISRKVNQLNFPTDALDSARGMKSEIILLRQSDGGVRYTGWFRTLAQSRRVLYTGFYMVGHVPEASSPCVKVVFPMPRGNATVILRPQVTDEGNLILRSDGRGFGDSGFYRLQERKNGWRVWRVSSLKETFQVYVDEEGTLRCDHEVRFLKLAVLTLHYKMERQS